LINTIVYNCGDLCTHSFPAIPRPNEIARHYLIKSLLRTICHGNQSITGKTINQNALGPRLQPSREVINIPIPPLGPDRLGIGVLAVAEKVISQAQISTKSGNAGSGTNPVVFSPRCQAPAGCGLIVPRQFNPKHMRVLGNVIADAPAPSLGKLHAMGGR
jgi:hypothetical protein